jgi:UDP-N-acetylglucosamine transferase subunit ALG13
MSIATADRRTTDSPSRPRDRRRVYLVATPGGHLDLLLKLRDSFAGFRRVWIVSPGSTADALIDQGEEIHVVARFHGFSKKNLRLAFQSLIPALRLRPRLIVTSGSGSVVPFCVLARVLGSRIIFVETMARVHNASGGGRVLSRLADAVLVQWPEMVSVYPGARACRPALLDGIDLQQAPRLKGEGTFLAIGTHMDPFDRLVRVVDDAVERGVLPRPVVAQTGTSRYVPRNFEAIPWLRPQEVEEAAERAQVVVSHAGSGMVSRALRSGLRPLVMARRADLGEHIDHHQAQLVQKLGDLGIVVPIEDRIEVHHLEAARRPHGDAAGRIERLPRLQDVLEEEVARIIRDRRLSSG